MIQLPDQLPVSIVIVVAVVTALGLIVWAFGKRLLRPMLILTGLAIGATVGLLAGAWIPPDVSIWWSIVGGIVVFGLLSLITYRFVMAALLAAAMLIACPLGFFAYAEMAGVYDQQPGEPISDDELLLPDLIEQKESLKRRIDENVERLDELAESATALEDALEEGQVPQEEPHWRRRLRQSVDFVIEHAANQWKDSPTALKQSMVAASAVGVVAGGLVGLLMPNFAASIVTALVGSLLWLNGGFWLLGRFAPDVSDDVRPGSAVAVLLWWLIAALVGVAVQFMSGRKKADKT